MFRAIFLPILRSTRLCLQLVVYNTNDAVFWWPTGSISSVLCTTSCKHSLVLLRMDEIIARNMLSWLKVLIKVLLLHLVGCFYYCINDARSHKQQILKIHNSGACNIWKQYCNVYFWVTIHFRITKCKHNFFQSVKLFWKCISTECKIWNRTQTCGKSNGRCMMHMVVLGLKKKKKKEKKLVNYRMLDKYEFSQNLVKSDVNRIPPWSRYKNFETCNHYLRLHFQITIKNKK